MGHMFQLYGKLLTKFSVPIFLIALYMLRCASTWTKLGKDYEGMKRYAQYLPSVSFTSLSLSLSLSLTKYQYKIKHSFYACLLTLNAFVLIFL